MNLATESYLFEQRKRIQPEELERARMSHDAFAQNHSPIQQRIKTFIFMLNRIRRIRIEVTFDYQEMASDST